MKAMFCGGALASAMFFALAMSPASAADDGAMLAQCNTNAENDELPPNVTVDDVKEFCTCLADAASDDQAVLDELTELFSGSQEERISRMQSGDRPSEDTQAAFRSCIPEGAGPPPQQ